MAAISFSHVDKSYPNGFHAVRDLNLQIEDGELVVLVGPSGCGKSTTLRMLAGLEEVTGGEIRIGDRVVNDLPPGDRDIAMVFQNYALYPHMSVRKNLEFGLKMRGMPRQEINERVTEVAQVLGIEALLDRLPRELSGGQRQRVAVGRAIVRQPQVFLFDEPLSNLDAKLRVQMRTEIAKLHQRLKTTMVYVTHDQVEAMTLGQRIVIMKAGVVHQVDAPLGLYNQPANRFVAGFIGSPAMNFVTGRVAAGQFQADSCRVEVGSTIRDGEAVLGVRPEDLSTEPTSLPFGKMQLSVVERMGHETMVYFQVGEDQLVARVEAEAPCRPGDEVEFFIREGAWHLFENEEDGLRLNP